MTRTLTLRIKPLAEARAEFHATFTALQRARGRAPWARRREGVSFTSIEAARRLLTPNRLRLLRAIRLQHPTSIYALARLLGRNLKNVQQDLRLLAGYGLVTMRERASRGNRRSKVPRAPFDEIALKIAI